MKAIAGIFIFLCFDTQPYGLQAFRTKPEMIVLGSSADKATTTRNFPVGAYTKTTSTTVQVISGVKKTHVVYTKHTMMALSDDKPSWRPKPIQTVQSLISKWKYLFILMCHP